MKITLKQKYYETRNGGIVVLTHKFSPIGFDETYYTGRIYGKHSTHESFSHISNLWLHDGSSLLHTAYKKNPLDIVKKSSKKKLKKYRANQELMIDDATNKYVVNI